MRRFSFSKNSFFIFISSVFIFMIIGLYFEFNSVIKDTNKEINKIELRRASDLSNKIIFYLEREIKRDFQQLFENRELREKLSSFLSLNVTDEFKYIYVIYRDKNGQYRYLLDGSHGVDRGEFKQKFYPLLDTLWNQSFKTNRAVYGFQEKADGLWLTYLHSIKIGGKIEAVLVLDISTREYENLKKFLVPLYSFLKIFISVLIIVVIVVLMQMYMFYKERKRSIVDSLTRLYNRNYLKEIWNKIDIKKSAIILLDIDHFKQVNDKYGHDVGDIVLSSVAKRLMSETRLEDRVIRYGGEEFLILLNFPKSDREVVLIANRIIERIANDQIRINENLSINITVSMGVNVNPIKSKSLQEAIKEADRMLYMAKHGGRNRIMYANLDEETDEG